MKKILFGIALLFMAGNLFAQEDSFVISYDEGQNVQDALSLKAGETIDIVISLDYKTDNLYRGMQFDLFLPKGLKILEDEYGLFWEPLGDLAATKGRNKAPVFQILNANEMSTMTSVEYVTDKEKAYGRYYRFICGQTENYQNNDYYYFPTSDDLSLYLITLEATEDYVQDPDIAPFYIRKAIMVQKSDNVKIDKAFRIDFNVKASGYSTLCIDDDLDFSNLDIKPFVLTDVKDGCASLTQVDKIEANTPVVIKGTTGHYVLNGLKGAADAITTNLLKGTPDAELTSDGNAFAMANKEKGTAFYRVEKGVVIPQYKAYLENATAANDFILFEDATGINSVEKAAAETDVYTITGVKVNNTVQKGVYIQNGKKVVVK